MNHLRPDEYVDAIDETLAAERRAHLASCGECRGELARLSTLLGRVREVTGPEPSPLLWGVLAERIRQAIASEGVPRREARWFQWRVQAPLGALAMIVLALVAVVPQLAGGLLQAPVVPTPAAVEPGVGAAETDAPWDLMAALVEGVDFEATDDAVAVLPGSADRAAQHLTAPEHQELLRLLREELQGTGG